MVENNCGTAQISLFAGSPEPNILFSTRHESGWVNGTELQAKDVPFRSLARNNFGFLAVEALADVPDNNHFFVVNVFSHARQKVTI